MKLIKIIVVFLMFNISCTNKNLDKERSVKSSFREQEKSIKRDNFLARFIGEPASFVDCGVIAGAYPFKFQVAESELGQSLDKTIIIFIPCPELLGKGFFKTGSFYHIETGDKDPDITLFFNQNEIKGIRSYYSKKITRFN